MKKFLPLLIISVLAGCAPNIIGTNFDDYVTQVGVPDSSYKLQSGNTLYSYKKSCKYYPEEIHHFIVEVDPQNKIIKKTDKTTCRIDQQKKKEERDNNPKVINVLNDLFPGYQD
ncbi:MAG: hypothetical protein K6E94_01930 [Elusimicrobiaceae bacterium]|nr:hypothetical protein [Elusimicrobiaceae bacterium]